MAYKNFKFSKALTQPGYLSAYCENIYNNNNYDEKPVYKNAEIRKVYVTEIWIIGEDVRQGILTFKNKNKINPLLLDEILTVMNTTKYGRGRESFVMTLHYFKNNPVVINILCNLLDDHDLYGFAIGELNKLRSYQSIDKVEAILAEEKSAWIKNEAKRYIKNSSLYVSK